MKKSKSERKRPQAVKNPEYTRAMQELRRSSAAEPHANRSKYNRKEKYRGKSWD